MEPSPIMDVYQFRYTVAAGTIAVSTIGIVATIVVRAQSAQYPWTASYSANQTIASRITPPTGYTRLAVPAGSFGAWLRNLPVKPGRPAVQLFDGRPKGNQSAQHAVLDIDVGARDLQQCADAVIRLRAEYLRAAGQDDRISFNFTSGHPAKWSEWKAGSRPVVRGRNVEWKRSAAADSSYRSFKSYLDIVFTYAGSLSLADELERARDPRAVTPGDVFIQGGSPGHAVIVLDVAESAGGDRLFLIAQSYMPAQNIHVLVNPTNAQLSPWYSANAIGPLRTPEWTFPAGSLRRFAAR